MSVIIPVYNAAEYVRTAAQSAIDQPETLEVILIDDGSTDGSLDVCRDVSALDSRAILLRHPDGRNHGPAASRNLGLRHARGPYAAFLDADDWYLPGRFAASVPILDNDPAVDGVYEAVGVEFEDEAARREWASEPHHGLLVTLPRSVDPDHLLPALLDGPGGLCTDGIVLRKRVFAAVGPFDADVRYGSDTAMWWKLAACHRLVAGRVETPVAIYRRHRANLTADRSKASRDASVRLAVSVWRWALERRLPGPTRDRIGIALIHRVLSAPPGTRGWSSVPRRARRIVEALRGCPGLLLWPSLWATVLAARLSAVWSGRRSVQS